MNPMDPIPSKYTFLYDGFWELEEHRDWFNVGNRGDIRQWSEGFFRFYDDLMEPRDSDAVECRGPALDGSNHVKNKGSSTELSTFSSKDWDRCSYVLFTQSSTITWAITWI
jgi:hypothetical protein